MNKEDVLKKFQNVSREFNGFSVLEVTAIVDDLIFLLNESETKINLLTNNLTNEITKNQNLEAQLNALMFSKKIEED
ncbi:hypothetical protein EG856_02635 [Mycoplasmopsis phocirhinis]|uniref:Uncharacterized protein n=1 Tax=Mycoplasmopsis phocirhinis TaxID=142650 RepID=A0A4P6MMQ3_9BACT|nr:hypothetical protein [Mycoplasmopsis phocirhinis]QBF34798.1 hypothetical protein EG856_02635 [Mycoplasmopsis phocirhinis]